MVAVFISHASNDGQQSAAVKKWLTDQGIDNVFLDFDKADGLKSGENWERRLYEEVARCHAVILIISPAWLDSKWCFAEFSMARSLGKVIFPILLRPDDINIIGPEISSIQAEQWNAEGKAHLAERLSSVAHEIARGHHYERDRPPYPGFLSFEHQDAAVFFGRDPEIREISERLEARRIQGGARLLMVVGTSGSGKSSVVKAGVLPWIVRDRGHWIVISPFRPGDTPMSSLAKALAEALGKPNAWKDLRDALIADPGAALADISDELRIGESREATILITIDQFEEAFADGGGVESSALYATFAEIAKGKLPLLALVTVRSDLMGDILQSREFTIQHEVYTLGKLPLERLQLVIEGPAQVAAIQLDRGLSRRIIDDAESTDALPLLAFALREMYERYGRGGRLTLADYEALGDSAAGLSPLENAIRRKAEETISTAAPSTEELDALKEAFVSGLVRVNIEGVRLRRSAPFEHLPEAAHPLIRSLINARLLSSRGGAERRTIEVAHEALFRAWPQLSLWLDDEQDFLIGVRNIEQARQLWVAAPEAQKDKALLSGLMLEKARDWTVRYPTRLKGLSDFVTASIRKDDDEKTRVRRRQVRLTVTSGTAAVLFAILGAAAKVQWGRAELAAREARENEAIAAAASQNAGERFVLALGSVAAGLVDNDPRLALFLASEAMLRAGAEPPGFYARAAMIQARAELATDGPHLLGSPISVGDALSIDLSPNGKHLAVGGRNGELGLVDTETGVPLGAPITGHIGGIQDLEFSPDGTLLASAGSGGEVRIWRIQDGRVRTGEVLRNFGDVAWSVSFDRSGKHLAATSETGLVQIWDVSTPVPVAISRLESRDDLLSAAFSLDQTKLIAGDGRGWIHGWDLAESKPLFPTIRGVQKSDIWQVLFLPSGERFASVSSNGSVALFDFPEGVFREYLMDRESAIYSAAFNKAGDVLIGGSGDGRLHLSYLGDTPGHHQSAAGHASRITEIAVSNDGNRLASLGRDQNVRMWTLFEPVPIKRDHPTDSPAKGVAISEDGSTLVSGGVDGKILIWSVGPDEEKVIQGHESPVWAIALSPGEGRIASADRSGHVRLWSTADGAPRGDWNIGNGAIWWLGFSPDGTRVYAAGDDGFAALDLTTDGAAPKWRTKEQLTGGAVSPDGKFLASTSMAGDVSLFEAATGKVLRQFKVLDDIVWGSAFSRDGRFLAVAGSNEVVSLWDVETGARIAEFGGHNGGATSVAFLADAVTLAATDRRGRLHLWDMKTQQRLSPPIPAHLGASWRVAAGVDENVFATSGDDGQVRKWDILSIRQACALGAPGYDNRNAAEYFTDGSEAMYCLKDE